MYAEKHLRKSFRKEDETFMVLVKLSKISFLLLNLTVVTYLSCLTYSLFVMEISKIWNKLLKHLVMIVVSFLSEDRL